nr:hypothetical protein [Tanacetum cinerariifolium]
EQCDAVPDAQVKVLSVRVVDLDSELMGMDVHLDEEFYPRFLTTIAGRRCLESQKDASIADIMSLLLLEGPSAETLEGSQLQPSCKQILLPINRKEDKVVIGETSLFDSLVWFMPVFRRLNTILLANVNFVAPISMTDYGVLDAKPQLEASYSPNVVFEKNVILSFIIVSTAVVCDLFRAV